jgi:hypothetical protein
MRGLYGQSEGNERRTETATFGDRIIENDIAEGEHVQKLRYHAAKRNWSQVTAITTRLKQEGHNQTRIDSMMSRAMAGLRF